jgi:hypothetical protein
MTTTAGTGQCFTARSNPSTLPLTVKRCSGEEVMSRWQKIGVLASLLWLIGLPIYLMTDSNRRASEFYNWCRKVESNLAFEMTAEQQHDACWRSAKFMTPTVLAQTLIAGNADTVTLWSFMLVPLAICWGIWGIMLATVRWKRRGF